MNRGQNPYKNVEELSINTLKDIEGDRNSIEQTTVVPRIKRQTERQKENKLNIDLKSIGSNFYDAREGQSAGREIYITKDKSSNDSLSIPRIADNSVRSFSQVQSSVGYGFNDLSLDQNSFQMQSNISSHRLEQEFINKECET